MISDPISRRCRLLLLSSGIALALCLQPSWGQTRFDKGSRSRSLSWGWGHSWKHGWPGYANTQSNLAFLAVHPQMGWFVSDRLELYGDATVLLYYEPDLEISAGILGLAGRYHFDNHGSWIPYVTLGAGLLWTSLDVVEIDRTFNFQVIYGGGLRYVPPRGPGWTLELRNHHISNAGTAGQNLGINAGTILFGIDWILR